jgi:hypothetical protein
MSVPGIHNLLIKVSDSIQEKIFGTIPVALGLEEVEHIELVRNAAANVLFQATAGIEVVSNYVFLAKENNDNYDELNNVSALLGLLHDLIDQASELDGVACGCLIRHYKNLANRKQGVLDESVAEATAHEASNTRERSRTIVSLKPR